MADINELAPKILKWEGGYVNNPNDHGGPTNMGITLATWQKQGYDKNHDGHIDAQDIKLLSKDDFIVILRNYWNVWKADQIGNQSVADILVDWVWGSGRWGVTIPQQILGVAADGNVGPKTLAALNSQNQQDLFNKIHAKRVEFLNNIVKNNPSQSVFLKGWLNRLSSFNYC